MLSFREKTVPDLTLERASQAKPGVGSPGRGYRRYVVLYCSDDKSKPLPSPPRSNFPILGRYIVTFPSFHENGRNSALQFDDPEARRALYRKIENECEEESEAVHTR